MKAAMSAAAGVVLPMPMSPVIRQSAPSLTRSAATLAPAAIASPASPADMAGSTARLPVPPRTFASMSLLPGLPVLPGVSSPGLVTGATGVDTPTLTTVTPAPTSPGDGVDGRASGEEVGDHLGGDFSRPGRHALGQHAVVAGEDHHHRAGWRRRRAGARDGGETGAERLEATK